MLVKSSDPALAVVEHTTGRTSDGIYYNSWVPAGTEPDGYVYLVHGMAEHSGRYASFARLLVAELNVVVIAHDQRAHGFTACPIAGDLTNLGVMSLPGGIPQLAKDFQAVISHTRNLELPVYVFGHSMGSVVARLGIDGVKNLRGLILSGVPTAPAYVETLAFPVIGGAIRLLRGIGHQLVQDLLITGKFDSLVGPVGEKNRFLSSDPQAVKGYNSDPMCGHLVDLDILLSIASTLTVLSETPEKIFSNVHKTTPFLFVSGRNDPVCNFGETATKDAKKMSKIGFTVTEIYFGNNCRHEFLNEKEPTKTDASMQVISWIRNTQRQA